MMSAMSRTCVGLAFAATFGIGAVIARGNTVTYTDQSTFVSHLNIPFYHQDLGNPAAGLILAPALTYSLPGIYSWTVDANVGVGGDTSLFQLVNGLSTNDSRHIMTFHFDSSPSPITAIGGHFFGNDDLGHVVNSAVEIQLADGTYQILLTPGFAGFVSTVPIVSMKVWNPDGVAASTQANTTYAGVSDLFVGTSVPVPSAAWMGLSLFAGLAGITLMRSKQRIS
jgi:hypothetical protein